MSRLLRWAGLQISQEPVVDPDEWTPVANDLAVDDAETGRCEEASRAVAALSAAGIEARQRAYVLQDDISMRRSGFRLLGPGPAAADRIRVAVLVQQRELERAKEILGRKVTKPDPPAN
ncbi:MAG: hypothetical protein ACRDL5_07500 [Solirubrobacteraceae bacterium]